MRRRIRYGGQSGDRREWIGMRRRIRYGGQSGDRREWIGMRRRRGMGSMFLIEGLMSMVMMNEEA